jgi:hypothetical protein
VTPGPTQAAGSLGCTYDVLCGRAVTAQSYFADTVASSFDDCLTFCDDNSCSALEYHEDSGVCLLFNSQSQAIATRAVGTEIAATSLSCAAPTE